MKVVCVDTDLRTNPVYECKLEWGKVYQASFVMHDHDTGKPMEWDKNLLNLEGFSDIDWFPTKNFVTIDVWRQKILNEIL